MTTVDTAVSLWTLQCLEADFSLDTAVSTWTLQCPQSNSRYHKTLNNFFPVTDIKFPSSQLIVQYYSWIFEMIFFTLAQNFAKNCGHCNIHGGHCSVHADTAVSTADTGRFLHTDKFTNKFTEAAFMYWARWWRCWLHRSLHCRSAVRQSRQPTAAPRPAQAVQSSNRLQTPPAHRPADQDKGEGWRQLPLPQLIPPMKQNVMIIELGWWLVTGHSDSNASQEVGRLGCAMEKIFNL